VHDCRWDDSFAVLILTLAPVILTGIVCLVGGVVSAMRSPLPPPAERPAAIPANAGKLMMYGVIGASC